MKSKHQAIIVMGVSGSGKTTIGSMLARELGLHFYDADNFHSESNRTKMSQNVPLTDNDRADWLSALRDLIRENIELEKSIVLACSALKDSYRQFLSGNRETASERAPSQRHTKFIYLSGTYEQIENRLRQRPGHFMSANMLASQFDILEEPHDALTIDITHTPEEIVANIIKGLAMRLPSHLYLDQLNIPFEARSFSPETEKGAANVARVLGFSERQAVKTLVFQVDTGERVLVMLGGDQNAISGNLKKAIGSRNIQMAAPEVVKETTGYIIGSIPAFGWQPPNFRSFLEASLLNEPILGTGAGQWGEEIMITPENLVKASNAIVVNLTLRDGQ
jgi:Cys-tRNA(Pro)/Cys-tRNA(Cys) deacylase